MRRTGVVAAMVVLGALPAPAAAQAPPSYGGGLLPTAKAPKHYQPTLGIVLQPRGGKIALRFDTSIRCGRDSYDAVGRKVVPFDGRSFRAKAASVFRIGRPGSRNRVVFGWTLRGKADGSTASGRVRITGARFVRGHRTECRRKPLRRWAARIDAPAPAGAPVPPARTAFGGLSDLVIADGLRGPVILRTTADAKRVAARWTVSAGCRKGGRQHLVNFTPPTRIGADGSFSRSERFAVAYADAYIRYRVQFSGRFSGEGAGGTLRMRARRYDRTGKRLRSRCDSGTRAWSAAIARPLAPAGSPQPAPPAPAPTPAPGSPVPGEWSLKMTSDAGDYIGQGQGWSHHPPGDTVRVSGGTGVIELMIDTADGGWWSTDFAAPPGQQLHVGTYANAHRYPFNDQSPGFDHSGMGRGCNESTSSFTITELTYDADLRLKTFKATFEQHCENGVPALHGTWSFAAA